MKNLEFFLILLFIFVSQLYSQQGWFYQQSNTGKTLYGVSFIDQSTGIAIGDSGIILKTTNGGNNWVVQTSLTPHGLHSLSFQKSGYGYVVGDAGIIFRSTDKGTTFIPQLSNTLLGLNSVHIIDSLNAVIVGDSAIILKTTNCGGTWLKKASNSCCYLDGVGFNSNGLGFAVGHLGSIVKTTDWGETWTTHYIAGVSSLHSVSFINNTTAIAVGNGGDIVKTTDSGLNWYRIFQYNYSLWDVHFINETSGWAVGSWIIQKTSDGGESWTIEVRDTIGWLFAVEFYNTLFGTTVGSYGSIIMTHLVNSNQDQYFNYPEFFGLAQNYPNPFNPSTKISWQSPVSNWQTLKVYDVLGNEVATLVNEYKPAGSYEIEFSVKGPPASNIQNLSSGIYFYQLKAGDFFQTKKMIFLQ